MWSLVLVLAALSPYLFSVQANYVTDELCTTKYGTASVTPVSTRTYALTFLYTYTAKFTTTPTSTITPPPSATTTTTTATTTTTVVTTPTDTFSETDSTTSTSTITTTTTTTKTDTATTTTMVATSTVPTPAGFTALAARSDYVAKKRFVKEVKDAAPAIRGRTVEERGAQKPQLCPHPTNPHSWPKNPTAVLCGKLVFGTTTTTKTYTAKTTATTTLPAVTSTATSTTTTTVTTTSAAAPASTTTTTTLSFSATATATATETDTTTSTVTVVSAAITVYAACATDNVVNHANGNQGIDGAYGRSTTNQVAISDPVACCVNCQQTAGCLGYAQFPGSSDCYFFTNGGSDG